MFYQWCQNEAWEKSAQSGNELMKQSASYGIQKKKTYKINIKSTAGSVAHLLL